MFFLQEKMIYFSFIKFPIIERIYIVHKKYIL